MHELNNRCSVSSHQQSLKEVTWLVTDHDTHLILTGWFVYWRDNSEVCTSCKYSVNLLWYCDNWNFYCNLGAFVLFKPWQLKFMHIETEPSEDHCNLFHIHAFWASFMSFSNFLVLAQNYSTKILVTAQRYLVICSCRSHCCEIQGKKLPQQLWDPIKTLNPIFRTILLILKVVRPWAHLKK